MRDVTQVFDVRRVEERARNRARKLRAIRDFGCRPKLLNRKRWPRRSRIFACRVPGVRARTFTRLKPVRVPRTFANACNTEWPGGYLYFKPGATLPLKFVRTAFVDRFPTNRRCYPQTGGGAVREPSGGTLGGAISFARNEAQRLSLESQREALRAAPRVIGTSLEAQNAFALRFGEDVCEPFFCAFDGESWGQSSNRSVLKGRGRFAEFASKGFRMVPLDITAIRAKVGREPTGTELIGACGTDEFYVQSDRVRRRSGSWTTTPRTALEQATQGRGPRRIVLKSGSAPLPAAPGAPGGPSGASGPAPVAVYPAGTVLHSKFGSVLAHSPAGVSLINSCEAYTAVYPSGQVLVVPKRC